MEIKKEYGRNNPKKPEKSVIDLFPDESPQTKKFSINAMEYRFQKVSFSGIFTVK